MFSHLAPQWFKLMDSEVSPQIAASFSSMATYLLLFASPLITPTKTTTSFPEQPVQKRSACCILIRKDFLPRLLHADPSIQPSRVSFIHVFPKRPQSAHLVRPLLIPASRTALSPNWMTSGLHANWKI